MLEVFLASAARLALAATTMALLSLVGWALTPRPLRPRRRTIALLFAISWGATVVGLASWLIGSFSTMAILPLIAALLLGAWFNAAGLREAWKTSVQYFLRLARSSPLRSLLLVIPASVVGVNLLLPLFDSDGVRYHVALPKLFVLTGKVFFYEWDVTGAYPQNGEMLYLAITRLGGVEASKHLHALFFAATLAVVMLIVHTSRERRSTAVAAGVLLAVTPVAVMPAGAAFIDHIALFHLAVGWLLILRRSSPILIGVALAGALCTKLTTGPAIACLAIAALLQSPRGGRLAVLGRMMLPPIVLYAPYGLRNLIRTGDPFFPIIRGVLRLPIAGVSEGARLATHFHSHVEGPLGIAWLPDSRVQGDEIAGIHHLAGLFLLLLLTRWPRFRSAVALVLPYLIVAALLRPPVRLLLPMFLALSVVEAIALSKVRERLGTALLAAVAITVSVTPIAFFARYREPIGSYLTGRWSKRDFLVATIPGFRAAEAVNRELGSGEGAVMALDFPAPVYLDHPWIAEGLLNDPPLMQWLREGDDAPRLMSRLREHRVKFILVTPGFGGGTAGSMMPLARNAREAGVIVELRRALVHRGTVDGVDLIEVPDR
jgi:hypothetical protein